MRGGRGGLGSFFDVLGGGCADINVEVEATGNRMVASSSYTVSVYDDPRREHNRVQED